MAIIVVLSHTVQNPLTISDDHTVTTVITAHAYIKVCHKAQNPVTAVSDSDQRYLLHRQIRSS
jgi:hypothetical protein